jgi:hypothetical protein
MAEDRFDGLFLSVAQQSQVKIVFRGLFISSIIIIIGVGDDGGDDDVTDDGDDDDDDYGDYCDYYMTMFYDDL